MSCTEIYGFDVNGNAYHYKDVPHAQCGAMAVWRFLEKNIFTPILYGTGTYTNVSLFLYG